MVHIQVEGLGWSILNGFVLVLWEREKRTFVNIELGEKIGLTSHSLNTKLKL